MYTRLQPYLRFAPLAVGLVLLGIGAFLVPWTAVTPYLARLTPAAVALLVALGVAYYLGRALRYWVILRLLGVRRPYHVVALAVIGAQPVAVLPGGELYRSTMLTRFAGVSHKHGLPSVFAQSIAESAGLLCLALIGAVSLHHFELVLLGIATVVAGILLFVRFQTLRAHRVLNRIPFIKVSPNRLRAFMLKNRVLLSGGNFGLLVVVSLVTIGAGIGIAYVAATAMGARIDLFQAMIGFTLPTVLESVSFLPGGLGVSEGGAVSIYSLFGTGLPLAVAITIVVRLSTLGLGFPLGFIALGLARALRLELGRHR